MSLARHPPDSPPPTYPDTFSSSLELCLFTKHQKYSQNLPSTHRSVLPAPSLFLSRHVRSNCVPRPRRYLTPLLSLSHTTSTPTDKLLGAGNIEPDSTPYAHSPSSPPAPTIHTPQLTLTSPAPATSTAKSSAPAPKATKATVPTPLAYSSPLFLPPLPLQPPT